MASSKKRLGLIAGILILTEVLIENKFRVHYLVEEKDGFLNALVDSCINFISLIAIVYLVAFGIDYILDLIGVNRTNEQRLRNNLQKVAIVLTLCLLFSHFVRILGLMRWAH